MSRAYLQLLELQTFEDRFEYLKLWNAPHVPPDDDLYRKFLKTKEWITTRQKVLDRDLLCDLGVPTMFADETVIVHHINPITTEDIMHNSSRLTDLNNLITTTISTHNAIHYKPVSGMRVSLERSPGDTTLW